MMTVMTKPTMTGNKAVVLERMSVTAPRVVMIVLLILAAISVRILITWMKISILMMIFLMYITILLMMTTIKMLVQCWCPCR